MVRLTLDRKSGTPLYVQLREQIKHLVLVGELKPGVRLPPASQLADSLLINRLTVLRAYRELAQQGYVEARDGLGTFVAESVLATETEIASAELQAALASVVAAALKEGWTPEQISYAALARARTLVRDRKLASSEVKAAVFECNDEKLSYYVETLGEALQIELYPCLIDDLSMPAMQAALAEMDLIVTSYFHFAAVRSRLRGIPELKHVELYAVVVRPHLDVLSKLGELPSGTRLGVLYYAGPCFTEARLQAMVEHLEHARLENLASIEPIYVQGELLPEMVQGCDAVLVRPENLAEAHRHLDLSIPAIQYHNVIDQASIVMLRDVVREIRRHKGA